MGQAFSDANIHSFQPLLQDKIRTLCSQLGNDQSKLQDWSPPRNMAELCKCLFKLISCLALTVTSGNRLSFDIMTEVTFNVSFDTLRSPQYRHILEAMEASNLRLSVLLQDPNLAYRKMDRHLFPKSLEGKSTFTAFLKKLLKQRLSTTDATIRDIFSYVLGAKDPVTDTGLSASELSTEMATLVVAGMSLKAPLFPPTQQSYYSRSYTDFFFRIRHDFHRDCRNSFLH